MVIPEQHEPADRLLRPICAVVNTALKMFDEDFNALCPNSQRAAQPLMRPECFAMSDSMEQINTIGSFAALPVFDGL